MSPLRDVASTLEALVCLPSVSVAPRFLTPLSQCFAHLQKRLSNCWIVRTFYRSVVAEKSIKCAPVRMQNNYLIHHFLVLGILLVSPLLCSSSASGHAPVFGPRTYTRTAGAPNTFKESFPASTLQGTFTLIVQNGDASGNRRVNSGSILLNGVEVVRERDFSQQAGRIEKIITILTNNSLNIQLRGGPPNSFITVSIIRHINETDGPVIAIEQPRPGQVFDTSPITVSGRVTDISGVADLKVNGSSVPVINDAFSTQVALTPGSNTITVQARDFEGNSSQTSVPVFLGAAKILSVNPNIGQASQNISVTITGQNTHFAQGATQASFGGGISVGGAAEGGLGLVTVTSPTSATAQLSINPVATVGPRTVSVQTGSEQVALVDGFSVTAPAVITSVNPNTGQAGQNISVTITGQNTHFVQGTTQASFGAGISVGAGPEGGLGAVNVSNPTSATAQVHINPAATVGPRTVAMQTGQEQASLAGAFTITAVLPPTISNFNPKVGPIGTLVNITGSNFAQGSSGPQVTLNKQNGGTIAAPVSGFSGTSISFVIPAGAATGPLIVAVANQSATSTDPLTVVASSSFDLTVAPGSIDVIQGKSGAFAVTLNSSNGFTQLTSLNIAGLPSGVTASFKPQQITAGQMSVLTIVAAGNQPIGPATLTLSAKATVDGIELTSPTTATLNIKPITTSFLGRTVVADTLETPLSGVTIKFVGKNSSGSPTNCSAQTVSDAAGNFAFTDLPTGCVGEQLIRYDGLTATSPTGRYAGVDLVYNIIASQVTVSPVLVHLPRIDDKETVMVQQNAAADQTFEFSTIPGLSVTVYAGTRFTLVDGTQPNPFPLAAVQVAVDRLPDAKPPAPGMVMVFIVAFQPANATASQPVAVYFPNTINTAPGTNMVLMTLDPTKGSMVPYGTGTVANDGSNVIPDFDPAHPGHRYGLVHFDWHGQMPPPNASNPSPDGPCGPQEGKPVDLASGIDVIRETDIAIRGGRGTIAIERTYRTLATNVGPFGVGTSHNYGFRLNTNTPQNSAVLNLIMPDGNQFAFIRQAGGTLTNSTIPALLGAVMTTDPDGSASLRWRDGTTFRFIPGNFLLGSVLDSISDANGNTITLTINAARPAQITEVTDPIGRKLILNYDQVDRITSLVDPIGRTVRYTYNNQGALETVTSPEGEVTRYDYDAQNRLTRVTDARLIVVAMNIYDVDGRVIEQIRADGGRTKFAYTLVNPLAPTSPVLQTVVTDPLGNQTTYRFNPQGFLVSVTDPLGQIRILEREQGTNRLLAVKGNGSCNVCGVSDASEQGFTYDNNGNVATSTDALGNTYRFTYEPLFNKVTSVMDPLGNTSRFTYDSHGNVLTRVDPNGHTTTMKYGSGGQVIEIIDQRGQKGTFSYDSSGNLIAITDPLGHSQKTRYDAVSRPIEAIDSLGRRSQTLLDKKNRVLAQINSTGDTTGFAYDGVNNILSVTDTRGNGISFTYDSTSRLISRMTASGRTMTQAYDFNDNLTASTDRRGQVTRNEYDKLNRLIKETFFDLSTVTRAYDSRSLLTSVEDSVAGDFRFTYDGAGRLTSSTSPFGTIRYSYDALNRVTTKEVVGQPAVNYSYDAAGNLLRAATAGAAADFEYDAKDQLVKITRSNGVSSLYTYDAAGGLMVLTHSKGTEVIHSQSYEYNPAGERSKYTSSHTHQLVTQPSLSTYDSESRQLRMGDTTYTYDENGNRLEEQKSSGTTRYTWDARNRLQSMISADGQTMSFIYDFEGNLISRNISLSDTTFTRSFVLDDLTNIAQITDSNRGNSAVLAGRGIDDYLAVIQPGQFVEYSLADSLNSTVATVNQDGAINSRFSYDPFGQTSLAGGDFPFQFTGKMPINNDIYYFRARYYDAASARFLQEDPVNFGSGVSNPYQYANNNPLRFVDPDGDIAFLALVPIIWAGIEIGLSVADGISTIQTLGDPCASSFEKAASVGLFGLGVIAPGGGYSTSFKVAGKGERFFKGFAKRNAFGHSTKQLGRFTEFSLSVPGNNGASFTRWVKVVNEEGKTIRLYHDTFDNTGRFINRGIKFPGPERHVR